MKITAVETFHVQHPISPSLGPSTYYYSSRNALLVKISTDEGLVGWGETAVLAGARALIDKTFAPMLIGQNPLEHRRLWRQMWGPNFGSGLAVGAVDIALHDLWGKALNVPIYALYGGRLRDKAPAYASSLSYKQGLDPLESYPRDAETLVAQGFKAIKLRIGGQPLKRDIAMVTAVRKAVGPDITLTADGNGAYTLATAIPMGRALEEQGYYWYEEPLPQPNYAGYETLVEKLDIAIAAGEGSQSRGAFKELLDRHVADIIQPDPILCGGIRECLYISEMARLYGALSMPHCWSGAITIASILQVLALLPDSSWSRAAESPLLELDVAPNLFRTDLITNPFVLKDGCIDIPTGPGLGIEINEDVIKKFLIDDKRVGE